MLKDALANPGLIKGGLTFLDNTLVYLTGKRPRRGPLIATWQLTYACNAKCSFCNTHELKKREGAELDRHQALELVRQLGRAGVWYLVFTGGEALLRPDLEALIKEAKTQGMMVGLNTNGLLLDRKAEMILETEVDKVVVSLDSRDPNVHDEGRGVPGLTEATHKGIERLRRERKGNRPEISLRLVVSKNNYRELDLDMEALGPRVDKFALQPIHDGVDVPRFSKGVPSDHQGILKLSEQAKTPYMFTPDDRADFAHSYNEFLSQHRPLDNEFNREFETFLFDRDRTWERYTCYAGFMYACIEPSGRLNPCSMLPGGVGGLPERPFMELWRDDAMQRWRSRMRHKQYQCQCWCGSAQLSPMLRPYLENTLARTAIKLLAGKSGAARKD